MLSMRVIQVAPTPFGVAGLHGGGERYPLELARALASQKDGLGPACRCELITFGPRSAERGEGRLHIRMLRSIAYLHDHPAHPVAPALPQAVWDTDIVHTHHMRSIPSRVATLTARCRRLVSRSGSVVVTDHGLPGGDWKGLLPRLFDRFLTVSAYSARELRAPPERTEVIYGGADPIRFVPDAQTVRRGALFVGRITPHKGIDRLIKALPDGASLAIAGSEGHDPGPPERDYPALLRRLAAGRAGEADITFLGPVADPDLPALYRQAAVLVLPSVHRTLYGREIEVSELLGLVLLEAMMSGTPVIASALGGIPEIVRNGITGFLVEPGNVRELGERLDQLLRDSSLAKRMGAAARELALERFTWDACAARCLAAYHALS
jgi:glycosyltransferase involved in cell wall biosynthesis